MPKTHCLRCFARQDLPKRIFNFFYAGIVSDASCGVEERVYTDALVPCLRTEGVGYDCSSSSFSIVPYPCAAVQKENKH